MTVAQLAALADQHVKAHSDTPAVQRGGVSDLMALAG